MSNASTKRVESRPETDARGPGTVRVTRARKGSERVSPRTVREALGKSQGEIAKTLETDQGEVSRIERRPGLLLSTLGRYATAPGATCEVAFVLPGGRRVLIALPDPGDPPPK